jgi:hypothetical protein
MTMPIATLHGVDYCITRAADMRALALAMIAAGVESIDVYIDGARFSSLDIATAKRSGGLVQEIGGHDDWR